LLLVLVFAPRSMLLLLPLPPLLLLHTEVAIPVLHLLLPLLLLLLRTEVAIPLLHLLLLLRPRPPPSSSSSCSPCPHPTAPTTKVPRQQSTQLQPLCYLPNFQSSYQALQWEILPGH
jgi:hypothetical protein